MNTLEDRLRTVLRTQAENFTAGPDSWSQTLERTRRPRRRRTRALAITAGAVAVAASAAIVLPITWPSGGSPGRTSAGSKAFVTAAYSVRRQPDGTIAVLIKQFRDPAGLQRALRAEGITAYVRYVPDVVKVQGENTTSGPSCTYQPPVPPAPYKFNRVFSFPPAKDMGPAQKTAFFIHPAAIPKDDAVFVEVDWFPPSTWSRLQKSGELNSLPAPERRDPAKYSGLQSIGGSFTLINKAGGLGPCAPNFPGPGYY